MGRSSRRAVRHELFRGLAADGAQQTDSRLSLRRPVGGLLPGGCQSTPLSRRSARSRPRQQEEARRRAEARLASLFRTEPSPGRRASAGTGRCQQLGCTGVVDGSDSDVSPPPLPPVSGSSAGAEPCARHAAPSATARAPSIASDARSTQSGAEVHRCRSLTRAGDSRRCCDKSDTQCCRSTAREPSPRTSDAAAGARCASVAAPCSELRLPASASVPGPAATGGDWTAPRRPVSGSSQIPSTPDEGEGLTPGPGGGGGGVRMEDFLDTVLGEVQAQLEQLSAGGPLVCDEESADLVMLYRRQPPPPPTGDCPLLQRLRAGDGERDVTRGGRGDSGAAMSQLEEETEDEDFVLQVCTSSQEDSALDQDPIRFLKMVEAASSSAPSGTGWLDAAGPSRGAPLRQCDLLTARTGLLRRSPTPPPAGGEDVGWLEAAVSPGRWPDWRGGGDILDVLDGPRPRWEDGRSSSALSAARHHQL